MATVAELVAAVARRACGAEPASRTSGWRAGLLRLALERRAGPEPGRRLASDRSGCDVATGVVILLAEDPALLDVAESLGREADQLVAAAGDPATAVVPAAGSRARLEAAVRTERVDASRRHCATAAAWSRSAAAARRTAAASGAGELHHRDLHQLAALALTFKGFGGAQQLAPDEIRERVRVRFPAVPALPRTARRSTPSSSEAGLALIFDDRLAGLPAARTPSARHHRPGVPAADQPGAATSPVAHGGAIGARLEQSICAAARSSPSACRADRVDRLVDGSAEPVCRDASSTSPASFSTRCAPQSEQVGLPWDLVRAADAEPRDEPWPARAWTSWSSARGARSSTPSTRRSRVRTPTDRCCSPRRRRWPATTTSGCWPAGPTWAPPAAARSGWSCRSSAATTARVLDGRPVPLAAPSQYVALDIEWIDSLAAAQSPRPAVKES